MNLFSVSDDVEQSKRRILSSDGCWLSWNHGVTEGTESRERLIAEAAEGQRFAEIGPRNIEEEPASVVP
ncbi:MAG: hypothetical protein Fues2KO_00620 [Fuerstiella sp.]